MKIMDVFLDANAYLSVLYNHGRGFFQTNQFTELLTYLRRTGSRLVISELTYNEVVARYRDRLTALTNDARDAWSTLQQVGMEERLDFPKPNIQSELSALGELLHHPAPGVQPLMYSDYSGVDVKEVAQRGIRRTPPANDKGKELRDVILWLIVLHYAKQSNTPVAFVSQDKGFQGTDGTLHPSLQKDIERVGVSIAFYRSVGDFVKGNSLASEPLEKAALAVYVSAEDVHRIATEQLLGWRFWYGTIVGAEVSGCELAEARQYRVGEDSYYVEARYTGEGTVRIAPLATVTVHQNLPDWSALREATPMFHGFVGTAIGPTVGRLAQVRPVSVTAYEAAYDASAAANFNSAISGLLVSEAVEKSYQCAFSLRLSLRIAKGARESLEVDEFILLGEITPVAASTA